RSFRERAPHAGRRAWSRARRRSSWNAKSLAGNGDGRAGDELLQPGTHLGPETFDRLGVERVRKRHDEAADPDLPVRGQLLDDVVGLTDERLGRGRHAVLLRDPV